MSSSDQESKTDGKLVSIPLSSDDETSAGKDFATFKAGFIDIFYWRI